MATPRRCACATGRAVRGGTGSWRTGSRRTARTAETATTASTAATRSGSPCERRVSPGGGARRFAFALLVTEVFGRPVGHGRGARLRRVLQDEHERAAHAG